MRVTTCSEHEAHSLCHMYADATARAHVYRDLCLGVFHRINKICAAPGLSEVAFVGIQDA